MVVRDSGGWKITFTKVGKKTVKKKKKKKNQQHRPE